MQSGGPEPQNGRPLIQEQVEELHAENVKLKMELEALHRGKGGGSQASGSW